jgi:hypothetical protein
MPGRNGKGPMGMGPRSGRGAGNCRGRGFGASGYENVGSRWEEDLGLNRASGDAGRGQAGHGRGWRNMFRATGLPGWLRGSDASMRGPNQASEEEKELLASRLEALQTEIESIKQRLSDMNQEAKG